MRYLLLSLLICFPLLLSAQVRKVQGIKDPGSKEKKKCKRFIKFDAQLPIEEGYFVVNDEGTLYVVVSEKKYADKLFKKRMDGFAVDVIKKEQYACEGPNQINESWAHKGTLLPPLFKKDFQEYNIQDGWVWIRYMKLPEEFDPNNVEYNLLVVQKKWRCEYRQTTGADYGNWTLLPTGLYRDSIPETAGTEFKDLEKVVSFTVPFEKDKAIFDSSSVKPLYDTLNFTDYVVKDIKIRAFASIEGSLERNIKLQEARAESIVRAMQAYQTEQVTSEVTASENWEQFRKEIAGSRFPELASLSKEELKHKLANDQSLVATLEPLLSRHRKAEIEVSLEKRLTLATNDPEKLKTFFQQRIAEKDIEEAIYIQRAIFEKIKNNQLPEDFIDQLEVPSSINYTPLLNNKEIFKQEQGMMDAAASLNSFLKLLELVPYNPKIQYNVVAIKTKLWSQTQNKAYGYDIDARIDLLEKSDLNPLLVARLRMNYNILLASYLDLEKSYARKNRILSQIFKSYEDTELNDSERLSLARYLVTYSRFSNAREILESRVNDPGASLYLLYYYISLTITDARNKDYQVLLDKAIEREPQTFCDLLKPKPQNGLSFQLLGIAALKNRFCEVCSDKIP